MTRRFPIIPTIIVVVAAATMIGLGIWQLQRAKWKESLIARYQYAEKLPPIAWPTVPLRSNQLPLFRHATGMCLHPAGQRATAGENAAGDPGYVHIVQCATGAEGPGMSVEVGWSTDPNAKVNWTGGLVSGIIAPDSQTQMRLVAASAPPGLEPSAPPSIQSIPNNHRSYAVQWFSFAAIALII
jgi:surfeit locus 1 family protein